ncbi:hypothetical protein TGVAND_256975, partial [Toxoplasma gondii VAND]
CSVEGWDFEKVKTLATLGVREAQRRLRTTHKDGQSIGWNSTFVGADLPSFAQKLSALLCLPHSRFFDACCLRGAHVCVDPFVCSNKANACRFL